MGEVGCKVWTGNEWTPAPHWDYLTGRYNTLTVPADSTDTYLFYVHCYGSSTGFAKGTSGGFGLIDDILFYEIGIASTDDINALIFPGVEGESSCIAVQSNFMVGVKVRPEPGHTWGDLPPGYHKLKIGVVECPDPNSGGIVTLVGVTVEFMVVRSLETVYVDCNSPQEIEDGSSQFPFKTLQEAIHSVAAAGTIFVMPGEYVGHIRGGRNVTIIGTGTTQTHLCGTIYIHDSTCELFSLSIEKGDIVDGALNVVNSTLVCEDVDIKDADTAISAAGATIVLNQSKIYNCKKFLYMFSDPAILSNSTN